MTGGPAQQSADPGRRDAPGSRPVDRVVLGNRYGRHPFLLRVRGGGAADPDARVGEALSAPHRSRAGVRKGQA